MNSTIVAISTPYGSGGIAVIRLSGPDSVTIAQKIWKGADLSKVSSHTAHFGTVTESDGTVLDEAVATLFRGPASFTGEDTVEFSVHGSKWIQRQLVRRLIEAGAVAAEPGEFTRRAFINGRMDLTQAEAVADLIASSSRAANRMALRQMAGGFSGKLTELREALVELASLLELELDFSEEDVEFADRSRLMEITQDTLRHIETLASTYRSGKAFKDGVPVAIAGSPNAGKSTLLNRLLGQEKAIVSDIPGTTRDVIEDTVEIDGILFRFFDTAGIRETDDKIERIGIDRAKQTIDRAAIIIWLLDPTVPLAPQKARIDATIQTLKTVNPDAALLIAITKQDIVNSASETPVSITADATHQPPVPISAVTGEGMDVLIHFLKEAATSTHDPEAEIIITNERHYKELKAGGEALRRASEAIKEGFSADLIAQDVREALHHLGLLTGSITTDTLLSTIFTRFCIGK